MVVSANRIQCYYNVIKFYKPHLVLFNVLKSNRLYTKVQLTQFTIINNN